MTLRDANKHFHPAIVMLPQNKIIQSENHDSLMLQTYTSLQRLFDVSGKYLERELGVADGFRDVSQIARTQAMKTPLEFVLKAKSLNISLW